MTATDLTLSDPEHEARLGTWTSGWDAAVAWLWPLLVRAHADADLWYERANNPGAQLIELRERRMHEAAEAHWDEFMRGGEL